MFEAYKNLLPPVYQKNYLFLKILQLSSIFKENLVLETIFSIINMVFLQNSSEIVLFYNFHEPVLEKFLAYLMRYSLAGVKQCIYSIRE